MLFYIAMKKNSTLFGQVNARYGKFPSYAHFHDLDLGDEAAWPTAKYLFTFHLQKELTHFAFEKMSKFIKAKRGKGKD